MKEEGGARGCGNVALMNQYNSAPKPIVHAHVIEMLRIFPTLMIASLILMDINSESV